MRTHIKPNHYTYAAANPLTYADPTGRCDEVIGSAPVISCNDINRTQSDPRPIYRGEGGFTEVCPSGDGCDYDTGWNTGWEGGHVPSEDSPVRAAGRKDNPTPAPLPSTAPALKPSDFLWSAGCAPSDTVAACAQKQPEGKPFTFAIEADCLPGEAWSINHGDENQFLAEISCTPEAWKLIYGQPTTVTCASGGHADRFAALEKGSKGAALVAAGLGMAVYLPGTPTGSLTGGNRSGVGCTQHTTTLAAAQPNDDPPPGNGGGSKPNNDDDDEIAEGGLIDELAASGVKHNPADIIRIARDGSGRIVFLENGTAKAELNHIVDAHGVDFDNIGIEERRIPDLVIDAVSKGRVVGYQGRDTGRPIYEVQFDGRTVKVAVTTGSNGFIVGANPVGR